MASLLGMGPLGSIVGRAATRAVVFRLALNTAAIITAGISTASGLEGTGPGGRRTAQDVLDNAERNLKDFGRFLVKETPKLLEETAPSIFPLDFEPKDRVVFNPQNRNTLIMASRAFARRVA